MEKLNDYRGLLGRLHECRENVKEWCKNIRDQHNFDISEIKNGLKRKFLNANTCSSEDFSHLNRLKTRAELVRISSAVMGIEFSYAAETAFVSPIFLQIGVDHQHMTLVWAISAFIGFFLCPILGSVSDRCMLNMGRRRPFILLLSIGVILGLLLIPNGEALGYLMGDKNAHIDIPTSDDFVNDTVKISYYDRQNASHAKESHTFGILFTIIGTVLLDFNADACQSPSRAFLLDVCIPEDHARGLSTFTIMAGLGGFLGYLMGSCNWDSTWIGKLFGGHVRAIFTVTTFIYIALVMLTVSSFRELPLWVLIHFNRNEFQSTYNDCEAEAGKSEIQQIFADSNNKLTFGPDKTEPGDSLELFCEVSCKDYNCTAENYKENTENEADLTSHMSKEDEVSRKQSSIETLSHYLFSIVHMPNSLRMVCLTNLFCWMAHVCYSLYFTDFVGEAVFEGDPKAHTGTQALIHYEQGIRFGCLGMAMYSLSCAVYSLIIENLIQIFRAKTVYVGGLSFYCIGMILMSLTRTKAGVIVFSWAAGVLYSTLFTIPYLLVAHYHSIEVFETDSLGNVKTGTTTRGLGTDIAIVSSMVFLAQFSLSICMGTIISWSGTTTSVVVMAAFLSFCAAICATKIMYLDL